MPVLSNDQKQCRICEGVKHRVRFSKSAITYDGLNAICKGCMSTIRRGKRRLDPTKYRRTPQQRLDTAGGLLASSKSRAKRLLYDFDLTKEWIEDRLPICEISGVTMVPRSGRKGRPGPLTPSIDRIDSNRGYTKDNCRIICFSLNTAFQDWGSDAFEPIVLAWAERLVKALPRT